MAKLAVLEGEPSVVGPLRGEGNPNHFDLDGSFVLLGKRKRSIIRKIGHGVAKAGRATGHAVAQTARVSKRVIARIVRGVAKKMLSGDNLLGSGSITNMSKTTAITTITSAGTVAVSATLTPAIGASSAPFIAIIAKEAVDEIYAKVKKKMDKGATKEQAFAQVDKEFSAEPSIMPYILGGVALVGLLFMLKKGRT